MNTIRRKLLAAFEIKQIKRYFDKTKVMNIFKSNRIMALNLKLNYVNQEMLRIYHILVCIVELRRSTLSENPEMF